MLKSITQIKVMWAIKKGRKQLISSEHIKQTEKSTLSPGSVLHLGKETVGVSLKVCFKSHMTIILLYENHNDIFHSVYQ